MEKLKSSKEKKEFTSSDMTKVFFFGLALGAAISKIMLIILTR